MLRVLCGEPFYWRPHEIGKLTPFQVREILSPRDSKGAVILDPPLGFNPVELTLAGEFRTVHLRAGVTDPDALAILVRQSLDDDAAAYREAEAAGAFEDDQ